MNKFIKNKTGQYSITTTTKCNWFCPYCIVNTHNLKKYEITIKEINIILPQIPNKSIVNITGGEPGLVSEDTMKHLIDMLYSKKCYINIFTNGKWLENFYKFIPKVNHIVYHISYTLEPIKIKKLDIPIKIDYKIVVDDNNFNNVVEFLKINLFVNNIVVAKGRNGLSKKNVINLIKLLKNNIYYFNILKKDLIL